VRRRLSSLVTNTAAIVLPVRLNACVSGAFHVDVSVVEVAQAASSVTPIASAVAGLARNIGAPFVRAPLPVARSAQAGNASLSVRARTAHADAQGWAGNSSCQNTPLSSHNNNHHQEGHPANPGSASARSGPILTWPDVDTASAGLVAPASFANTPFAPVNSCSSWIRQLPAVPARNLTPGASADTKPKFACSGVPAYNTRPVRFAAQAPAAVPVPPWQVT
jgi:hypothetical protein